MFLPSTSSQEDVFEKVRAKELVEAALDGFPVTIFAYGQTGAGKSFTIFGREDGVTERKMALHEQDGLLPRTAQELMNSISARKGEVEYTLRVTCVEIYNEQVRDVFDPRKETLAEKLIKDLREQIRQLKLENMMLRARTPGYFLEHPDHKLDSSALLSDREDEYPDSQKQKQRHGKAESLNQPEDTFEARHRRNPSIRQKAVQQDLQTL
ncbi:hypothetical protein PRNP1_008818 [Phytophthora ramorum]